ncbi:MAG: carboxypeptidase regulatory-like domain-containing protein [Acidobacteria bacterium]|nr:carboxypeptidase regulatory-like domain-containing protein [Acidobacteriota bacterium]
MSSWSFVDRRVLVLLALCLAWSGIAFSQSDTAQIAGLVRDPSGAVIASANVVIRNEATGMERRVQSNEAGYYVGASLPPGYYTVTVEATGFKKAVRTQTKLDANVAATVNVTLEVGAVTETVEVVASVVSIQTETATVGKVIQGEQIKMMSLNGRNPLFLALLKPGVRGGAMNGFSFGLTSGGLSINGSRTQDFLITFDGAVGVRTRANGTSVGTADLETIQEMQILTANYNAEYGRSGGGQVRMVTRSGSRDFHGTLYEYFRNNTLDANSWSRNRAGLPREARRFNQFGYNIGGPAYIPGKWNTDRSKVFFMWSQEWVRFRREVTTIQTVPSLAMRGGNFSELLSASNTFFGRVRAVNDPTNGQPFAGNIIPQARLSSNGTGFLRSYPEPTPGFLQGTNNFIQTRPQPENQRKDTVAVDVSPTDKHMVRFRFQQYSWVSVDAFRSGFDRAVTDWNRPNQTASLNYIWTVNPRTINEFLATASVDRVYIGIYRPGERFARSKYGISYPYIFPERKEIFDKIPTLDIANFGTIDGGPYPSQSTGPIYNFSDQVTRIAGSHTLKFGIAFERLGQNDFDQINVSGVPGGTNNQNGRFVFTDTRAGAPTSGIAIGNTVLGLFDTYAEIGPRAYTPYRAHMWEWFAQDSWRVNPKLKLELGVRYTIMTPYYWSMWRNMAVFDPSKYDPSKAAVLDPRTGNVISGDRYNGVVIPGTGWPDAAKGRVAIADSGEFNRLFTGGDKWYGQTQKLNFQPRFGLAYSITSKTVFRAGGGRFMSRPGVADNIFLGGNPPFQPMVSVAQGQADNPGGGGRTLFPQFFMTQDPAFKVPTSYTWSVGVQREVGFDTTVEVSYVGRTSLYLERERDLNQLKQGTLQANPGVNVNFLRPYKGFAFVPMNENAARAVYNGLQIEANRRFSRGLLFGVAYTHSKSSDNASGRRDRLYDAFNDKSFWGSSSFDTRHIAVINALWQIPVFKDNTRFTGKVLGGWQVSGATQFQTGTPITVGTGDDFPGIGSADTKPWNVSGDASLARGDRAFSQGASDSNFWFRARNADGSAIFTIPAAGAFGNQNRNSLPFYNVGFQNWNLAVFKDFTITERHRITFRTEFFNWPNHPNWNGADTGPRSATFGKVTGKGSERNIQLSLRYSF